MSVLVLPVSSFSCCTACVKPHTLLPGWDPPVQAPAQAMQAHGETGLCTQTVLDILHSMHLGGGLTAKQSRRYSTSDFGWSSAAPLYLEASNKRHGIKTAFLAFDSAVHLHDSSFESSECLTCTTRDVAHAS